MYHFTRFILAMLMSVQTLALGTGSISLHSQLGEKLLVETPLIGSNELNNEQIRVRLAEADIYQELGVDFLHLHRQLQFKIVRDENNKAILLISSKSPITEPFLNFILHIKTPSSNMMKEFSLLLDTPITAK